MNIRKGLYVSLLLTAGFGACQKKDKVEGPASFRPAIDYNTLNASSNYFDTFRDEAGVSTVNFSGQTVRQDMLAEMDSVMRIPTGAQASRGVPAGPVEAALLKNMYAHTGSPFRQSALNEANTKTLKGKTAASFSATDADAERSRMDGWLEKLAAASASFGQQAANGQAGIAVTGSGSKYLVDENGIEYGQLVQKGLIGAVLMDQMLNVYLGNEKLSLDNSKAAEGVNYTEREHSWDEAYGYLTKNSFYPTPNPADNTRYLERYLGNYVRPVGDASALYLAFLKGRAAVVNDDATTLQQQVSLIRDHVEEAIASFAISYLNKTKTSLASDPAAAMHAFAEGVGFIYALRFGPGNHITKAESDGLMNQLIGTENGFYSLTPAAMDAVINEIAGAYGLDPATVVSH